MKGSCTSELGNELRSLL